MQIIISKNIFSVIFFLHVRYRRIAHQQLEVQTLVITQIIAHQQLEVQTLVITQIIAPSTVGSTNTRHNANFHEIRTAHVIAKWQSEAAVATAF